MTNPHLVLGRKHVDLDDVVVRELATGLPRVRWWGYQGVLRVHGYEVYVDRDGAVAETVTIHAR